MSPGLALAQPVQASAPAPAATPAESATAADPGLADPQDDQAIVPEQEFEQALPPISGDINAPLEPIPTAPSQTGPVIAAPDTELPPATAPSPELAQPLQPLQTFDTTPPVDVADVKDADAPEIAYETQLKGLDGIGDLESQWQGLSALRNGHGKAANATMINARAREDAALAVRLMKSLGYYDGTATPTIVQAKATGGKVQAIVTAVPDKAYALGSITVKADPTVPPNLVTDNLPLKIGDPIEAGRIQGAEANVSLILPQRGYPFVKVGDRDILLDDQTLKGDYTLPVDTGPRSSFGTYTTDGKLAFDAKHVGVLSRFKKGELYDNRKVDDLRDALVATGLFSSVAVEPQRTGTPGPDGTEQVNLLVHQQAGPPRSLALQGGYSTGEGIKLEGSFTHRNIFPPEGALIGTIIAGTQEQGLSGTFRRMNAGKRDKTVQFGLAVDHSNYDAYNAFTSTLFGKISYDSTPLWQKKFTYAYGFEFVGTNESVYDFGALKDVRKTFFIAALPTQGQFDTTNDLLNPTKGYRLKLSVSPEASVKGRASPYVRTMIEGSTYFGVSDSIVLAGRVRVGSIDGIPRDELAPSRRYYGGGGGSVRGYGYQRLGPLDPNGDPVGGRSINEVAIEARYRTGNIGIVPFIDAGNAYESSIPKFNDLKLGAGIGGRYYTNFGPLRIDVATPLNRRKGDGLIALYLSIGQAF